MKKFKIEIEGTIFVSSGVISNNKVKTSHDDEISCFNLNHALSYCMNYAKENKLNIKKLSITENV